MKTLNEVKDFLKESMTPPAYADACEAIDTAIREAYNDGYYEGHGQGYQDGWDNGYDSGREYDDYYKE